MSELETSIKDKLIKYCYDEIDNGVYQMYLSDVSNQDWDYLFIRVEDKPTSKVQIYVTDHDDLNCHFVYLNNLGASIMIQVLNQMLKKKEEKTEPIKQIVAKFKKGYDIPSNVAVPSIVPYLTDKCKNSDKTWVGEVGLSGDDNGTYISVFFPDKIDPAFSHDTPLEKLNPSELKVILDNLEAPKTMEDVFNEMNECVSEFFNDFRVYKP